MSIKSESILYWFLRLNGFFTIKNFLVHNDSSYDTLTEIDVVGVRFPDRKENFINPMNDVVRHDKIIFLLGDAKNSTCKRNDTWKNEEVVKHILSSIGFPHKDLNHLSDISNKLIHEGSYEDEHVFITYLIAGNSKYKTQTKYYQLTWKEIKHFIFDRFNIYREQKKNNSQWDEDGKEMWNLFELIIDNVNIQDKENVFIEYLKVIP